MAGAKIRGITIEIGADTSKFASAFRSLNSTVNSTKSQLRDVERLLKFNPKNTELLSQKQKILANEISATKAKLEELKRAEAQMKANGVDENSQEFMALRREILATENQLKNLKKEYANFGSVAAQKIAAVGETMQDFGKKLSQIGTQLTQKVTLPLVALGTVGVKKFAEVDKVMQLTNKTMGNTEEEAKTLDKAMKDAAANSTFGMSDAATATLNFARAGLDAAQAAAALAPAMNLAAGEGGNLETVSAGLVGTINGFGDSFENTSHYADVFAAACNNSALDVDSLANSMGVAAPVFRTAGKSVEDAALYLGIMANNNIDANTAANALKTGMMRLAAPTKQATEAMEKYGINASDIWGEDGSMKDAVEVQAALHDSFAELNEQEQLAAASAIFGKNQGAAWLALINSAPSDVRELADEIEHAAGTTDEMSNAMMQGFGGSIEKLKSSIDVAATSLGQALAPTISKVADKIQKAVDWFNNLSDAQKELIAKVGLAVAALGPMLVIGGKIISGGGAILKMAPKLVKGAKLLGTGINLLTTGAMGPWILAIGAAIAAGVLIYKNWDKIKAFAKQLLTSLRATFEQIKTAIVNAWNNIKTATTTTWNLIKAALVAVWNAIKTTTVNTWNAIKTAVSTAWNNIKAAVSSAVNAVKSTVTNAWNNVRTVTTTAWANIRTAISDAWTKIRTTISNSLTNVKTKISNVWTSVKTATSTAWENVKTAISDGINAAKEKVSGVVDSIKTAMSNAWESAKTAASNAFSSIKESITNRISNAKETISGIVDKIKGFFPLKIGNIFEGIKTPHFSVDWGSVYAFGRSISFPRGVSVSWYKKAMNDAVLLNGASIFGSMGGKLLGGGEAGREVVISYDKLAQMIGGGNRGTTVTNNIVINAAPGMNERQLADVVARRIQNMVVQKGAVWA